jgi:hypothetical protein
VIVAETLDEIGPAAAPKEAAAAAETQQQKVKAREKKT